MVVIIHKAMSSFFPSPRPMQSLWIFVLSFPVLTTYNFCLCLGTEINMDGEDWAADQEVSMRQMGKELWQELKGAVACFKDLWDSSCSQGRHLQHGHVWGILKLTWKAISVAANTGILPKATLESFLWRSINGSFIFQFSNSKCGIIAP